MMNDKSTALKNTCKTGSCILFFLIILDLPLQAQDNTVRDNTARYKTAREDTPQEKPASDKPFNLSAGIEYALSTYSRAGKLDLSGQGIFLQGEKFFSKQPSDRSSDQSTKQSSGQSPDHSFKQSSRQSSGQFSGSSSGKTYSGFSGTLSLGWLHFSGTVTDLDSSVQTRFSILPILVGARYYWKEHFYLGIQVGALVSTNDQTNTHLALVPGIGMIAPVGESLLELSLQFTGVPTGYGLPEKTVLQRGGYSFAELKIAYKF
jgi:hypothetical protein